MAIEMKWVTDIWYVDRFLLKRVDITKISKTDGTQLWPSNAIYPGTTSWSTNTITWNHSEWEHISEQYPQTGEIEGNVYTFRDAEGILTFNYFDEEHPTQYHKEAVTVSGPGTNEIIISWKGTPVFKIYNNGAGYTPDEPPYGISVAFDKAACDWYGILGYTTKYLELYGKYQTVDASALTRKETYFQVT